MSKNDAPFEKVDESEFVIKEAVTISPPNSEKIAAPSSEFFGADDDDDEDFDEFEDFGSFDDSDSSDDFGFNEETKREDTNKKERSEKTAKTVVANYDMFIASLGQFIGGQSRQSYKMEKDERDDLTEAAAEYFMTVDFDFSPGMAFFMAIVLVTAPTANKIKKDREARIERDKYQKSRAAAVVAEQTQGRNSEAAIVARKEAILSTPLVERKQFDVDKKGRYKKTKGGTYLAVKDRSEIASPEIIDITARCMAEDPDTPQAMINAACLSHIHSNASMSE